MPLAKGWQLFAALMPQRHVDAGWHCLFTQPFLCLFAHTAWRQSSGVRSSRETGRRWLESTCPFCTTRSTATPSRGKMACKGDSLCTRSNPSASINTDLHVQINTGALSYLTQPLGSTFAFATISLWHGPLSPDQYGKMQKRLSNDGRVSRPGSYPKGAQNKLKQQHIVP